MKKPLKILIAPDSFKESMTALEASMAIEAGFKKVFPDAVYKKIPMADGGEGTVQAVVDATGGKCVPLTVRGPLEEPVEAFYGLSGDKSLAVIELAAASGLHLIKKEKRNPLKTTTWGFGELIADALDQGVSEILLGIGGSATNNGGAGMIQALGGRLLDPDGSQIEPTGGGIGQLSKIDLSGLHARVSEVTFRTACDVDNPLTGKNGASYIYGPQKGASRDQIKILDRNLKHFAKIIWQELSKDVETLSGAGAAGGLGAGLAAFLKTELVRGGDLLVNILKVDEVVQRSDLVITGEGGVNHQTAYGKTPVAVAEAAKKHGVAVICLAGTVQEGYSSVYEEGVDAVFPILPELDSLENILKDGEKNLERTAENIARVIKFSMEFLNR